jgi:putative RNA 2'-phosphotransferase
MNKTQLTKKSKFLSLVLRHDPGSVGLKLDEAGWCVVDDLLRATHLDLSELEEIVEKNDKKRFEFDSTRTQIRASQGHSVEVELGYEEKEPPWLLYHGTSKDSLVTIRFEGLLPMERHDVHLSASHEAADKMARERRKNPIVLVVRAGMMHNDGHKFRLSTNGVWLVPHVPEKYLPQV